jgi:membrane protease subunit HflK
MSMEETREETWKDILLAGLRTLPYRNRRLVSLLIVVVIAIYFLTGIYAVQPEELGVVVRFGRVVAEGVPPGIHYHLPRPFEKVYKPKTAEIKQVFVGSVDGRRATGGLEMITGDTNVIMLQVIIQYAISKPVSYLFSTEEPENLVAYIGEEALARIVGSMGVDDLLTTEKLKAQDMIKARVQEVLNTYDVGVEVIGAYFQEISPPVEVAYAFRDVASAREDRNRIINEAEGYRNTILPTTRGLAQGIVSDAEGYSKERVERATGEADRFLALMEEYQKNKDLTASRLYMEKMERILPYLRIYVVDQEGGEGISNLRLMLPRN